MVAGHTKFAADRLTALLAKKFYSSDQPQHTSMYKLHCAVTNNDGGIVRET